MQTPSRSRSAKRMPCVCKLRCWAPMTHPFRFVGFCNSSSLPSLWSPSKAGAGAHHQAGCSTAMQLPLPASIPCFIAGKDFTGRWPTTGLAQFAAICPVTGGGHGGTPRLCEELTVALNGFPRCKQLISVYRQVLKVPNKTPLSILHEYATRLNLEVRHPSLPPHPPGRRSVRLPLDGTHQAQHQHCSPLLLHRRGRQTLSAFRGARGGVACDSVWQCYTGSRSAPVSANSGGDWSSRTCS